MRVYGLTSPTRSLGWPLGAICFALTTLYPPFPGSIVLLASPLDRAFLSWRENFSYVLTTGGLLWQILADLHRQSFAWGIYSRLLLISQFAPMCFVPVALMLSTLILWRRIVDYAPRPTILRGILAMSGALLFSLILIFLLDWVGGRVLLYMVRISLTRNIEVRNLISVIWITAIIQSAVFALPCLALGGLFAWRQGYLETRHRALRHNIQTARQELEE